MRGGAPLLNWFNCMLEFAAYLGIYFCLSSSRDYSTKNYLLYFAFGALASIYFINAQPQILPLNIILYTSILLLSFSRRPHKNSLLLSVCSIPLMLILEFTLHSLLPVMSMQTDIGNLITNIVLLLFVFSLLAYLRRIGVSSWVSAFFIQYFPIVIIFTVALVILGQVYLSRLSSAWSYLPGLITLIVFLAFMVVVYTVTRYHRSEDRLRSQVLEEQIQNSESFVVTMKTQLHDYKHHIQYLLDQIQSTPDLTTLREETSEYLVDLDHDRSFYDCLIAIDQPVFRASLFGCFARCKKQNIPFQLITGDLLPHFPLKDYQLVEVLENLISNAIEHNLSLPEEKRYLLIRLSADGRTHRFSIENPADNIDLPLSELYKNGTTSKDGHPGLGLGSIQKTLADHDIHFAGSRNHDTGSVSFELIYEEKTNDNHSIS